MVLNQRWICSVPFARGQHPEPTPHGPDSPPSRDFAFALTSQPNPAHLTVQERTTGVQHRQCEVFLCAVLWQPQEALSSSVLNTSKS